MSFGIKDKKLYIPTPPFTNSVSLSKLPNRPDVTPSIKRGNNAYFRMVL